MGTAGFLGHRLRERRHCVSSALRPSARWIVLRCTKARLYYPRRMSRAFEKATLADAVGRLRSGMKVLLPAGCGEAIDVRDEILRQADRLAPLTLMGGLRLDDYPFARPA